MTKEEEILLSRNLSNNQIQDILENLDMIDDNGHCPYTAEEIFKAGVKYADSHPREGLWDANKVIKWLQDNADSYTWYNEFEGESGMTDDFIEDLQKAMKE